MTATIIYLQDRMNGLHCYTPELNERRPETKMRARLAHYGKHYFVDTPIELKGRGITEKAAHWADGCKEQIEGWRCYLVTARAFEKLTAQYPISMKLYLD